MKTVTRMYCIYPIGDTWYVSRQWIAYSYPDFLERSFPCFFKAKKFLKVLLRENVLHIEIRKEGDSVRVIYETI